MSQNGKGDRTRQKTVDYSTWEKNWENIFRKNKKNSREAIDKTITDDRMKELMREDQSSD
jgi:isopropylmalate/homocitrate/citramalate synthase